MTIEWHYNENPPEPEGGCQIRYLVALHSEDHSFTETAYYNGDGVWSDVFNIITEDVYAWAEWPGAPPQTRATAGGRDLDGTLDKERGEANGMGIN